MTPAEILTRARGLIDTPEKWCQGSSRTDGRICAAVALNQAAGGYAENHVYDMLVGAFDGPFRSVSMANDTSTHSEVMQAFSMAIAAARAQEAAT